MILLEDGLVKMLDDLVGGWTCEEVKRLAYGRSVRPPECTELNCQNHRSNTSVALK